MAEPAKPRVLILGGVGFIGRNLVEHLVSGQIASQIRVIDKVLPQTAYLSVEHAAVFEKVEYLQKKLNSVAQLEAAFSDGGANPKWDVVINLAAETKYGLEEPVYDELVYQVSVNAAKTAAKFGVGRFIEVSTAQVYAPSDPKKPKDESGKIAPWTLMAKHKVRAEEEIRKIAGLNWIIVRPAFVYGPGDRTGLMPRVVVGAVYKQLVEKMKLLYSPDLRINTVHVHDVVRALVFLAQKAPVHTTFNLADKFDTDQQKMNVLLEKIFKIQTGFTSKFTTMMTSVSLKMVTDEVNDKHVQPWVAMCKDENIANSPISPYLDPELLTDASLSVNGSAIESLGFKYEHPVVTEEALRQSIDYWVKQRCFPRKQLA